MLWEEFTWGSSTTYILTPHKTTKQAHLKPVLGCPRKASATNWRGGGDLSRIYKVQSLKPFRGSRNHFWGNGKENGKYSKGGLSRV